MTRKVYGTLANGHKVFATELKHGRLTAVVLDYGLRLCSLDFMKSRGRLQPLVLGGWPLSVYEFDSAYHGAVIGRTCNRISEGQLQISGKRFQLDQNEGVHHLHGGFSGLHNRVWQVASDRTSLLATTKLSDGESGYPGNVQVEVKITNTGDALVYEYSAVTDADTVIDMTNHAYFCLDDSGTILEHELQLAGDQIAMIDEVMLPTGELMSVRDTPFDFKSATRIGTRIGENHPQLILAAGYDHSWLIAEEGDAEGRRMATLRSPRSAIGMSVVSSSPAVQVYTGNHLSSRHAGVCLETQHLPDSFNQTGFKQPIVHANESYQAWSRYEFYDLVESA